MMVTKLQHPVEILKRKVSKFLIKSLFIELSLNKNIYLEAFLKINLSKYLSACNK